ncbi:MAG: hypothetical protein AAGB01_12095, partial [Cyanobacteria bacterium P01_F01_bin.42]
MKLAKAAGHACHRDQDLAFFGQRHNTQGIDTSRPEANRIHGPGVNFFYRSPARSARDSAPSSTLVNHTSSYT